MSFIRRPKNGQSSPTISSAGPAGPGPCPVGPPGIPGSIGTPGIPGSPGINIIPSGTGVNCTPNVSLPNGSTITIPYTNNGWYYNMVIPPMPKKEAVKVKPKDGRDGCDCVKCQSFFQFAEPNQEDGTLICWACRHGY